MKKTVTFELKVVNCPCCGTRMMKKANRGVFPFFYAESQEAQMKKLGIVFISDAELGDDKICENCKKHGKAAITCYLCGELKGSDLIEEIFGVPAEYLCKDCYSTTPAKTWDDLCEVLRDSHKYDYY